MPARTWYPGAPAWSVFQQIPSDNTPIHFDNICLHFHRCMLPSALLCRQCQPASISIETTSKFHPVTIEVEGCFISWAHVVAEGYRRLLGKDQAEADEISTHCPCASQLYTCSCDVMSWGPAMAPARDPTLCASAFASMILQYVVYPPGFGNILGRRGGGL